MLRDTQERVALNVSQAYMEILRLRQNLAHLSAQKKTIGKYLYRIKKLSDEGVVELTEWQLASDVLTIIEGNIIDHESQLLNAKSFYYEVVGSEPYDEMEMPSSISIELNTELDDVIEDSVEKHPVVNSARMDSEAAKYDVNAQVGQTHPDVNGELSYLFSDKREDIGGSITDARAVVRLNWNFSLGKRGDFSIKQKQFEHKEMLARQEEICLLYTSPSPRDQRGSRMPSSA